MPIFSWFTGPRSAAGPLATVSFFFRYLIYVINEQAFSFNQCFERCICVECSTQGYIPRDSGRPGLG